jgi:hypothetical protein
MSVFFVMQPTVMITYKVFATVLMVGYVVALGLGSTRSNTFELPFSNGVAELIFGFLLTTLASFFTAFWNDVNLFVAITEPFVAMRKGANANDTLLLNYTCSAKIIAIYEAMTRRHWKVFKSGLFALIQRLFPILIGSSITVNEAYGGTTITFSTPLSFTIIIWLVVYIVAISYEIIKADYSRHLPRDYVAIADLLSWACSSDVLRNDTIRSNDTDALEDNPLDHASNGPGEKWYMEARLRLAQQIYRFDLARVPSQEGLSTIGISTSDGVRQSLDPPQSRSLFGRRKATRSREDGSKPLEKIAGAKKFKIVDVTETNLDSRNAAHIPATSQAGETEEQETG